MTLDEFRLALDGEYSAIVASSGYGTRLVMRTNIVGGEAKYTAFTVEHKGDEIWSGHSFSTATRRYWEIAFGGKK